MSRSSDAAAAFLPRLGGRFFLEAGGAEVDLFSSSFLTDTANVDCLGA